MDKDNNNFSFLKWLGVALLIAIPVYFITKYVIQEEPKTPEEFDEDNIFASELE
ncbi:MAG: hypothetical protein IGBAC_1530 [Ignavibacteriae bacterium]|nr:MAG: hypothetical protein IGBAC_1530 [Ignavibacteriota bacterium]